MRKQLQLTTVVLVLALAAIGCGSDSSPAMDSCTGPLTGTFSNSNPSNISMATTQCGQAVNGTMMYGSDEYVVTGVVEADVYRFSTGTLDFCATLGIRRTIVSTARDYEVQNAGETLEGQLAVRDASCSSGRTGVTTYASTFSRM